MSWQPYIDQQLIGTGMVDSAVMVGFDGTVWAKSDGLECTPDELTKLIAGFNDPSKLRENGMFLQGDKYIIVRSDDRSIYGKLGTSGVACVKTNSCVIIGHYNENVQPGQATVIVENLADYLISVGY
mmetsp:Transcript_487/g.1430  ORF Transcript_487/g.1430 Transcript_487/m.1430 type:complete len:127 (+) Transcript_487:206-586(+)